jgi:hypothetical protein
MLVMTDQQAIDLANALGRYCLACMSEGMAVGEVADMSVRDVVQDVYDSTSRADEFRISDAAHALIDA